MSISSHTATVVLTHTHVYNYPSEACTQTNQPPNPNPKFSLEGGKGAERPLPTTTRGGGGACPQTPLHWRAVSAPPPPPPLPLIFCGEPCMHPLKCLHMTQHTTHIATHSYLLTDCPHTRWTMFCMSVQPLAGPWAPGMIAHGEPAGRGESFDVYSWMNNTHLPCKHNVVM